MNATYRCWNPDSGGEEDARPVVNTYDAEMAAKQFAEWYDWNGSDYVYATSGGEVCVRKDDGPVQIFCVVAESIPMYSARLKRERPA